MGRWLFLPFFVVYLGVLTLPTFLSLVWVRYWSKIVFLLAMAIIILLIVAARNWYQLSSTTSPTPLPDLEVRNQYAQTLKLLDKQPTHRDLLINAARLANELGNSTSSAEFLERARRVDPNSPLLQSEF